VTVLLGTVAIAGCTSSESAPPKPDRPELVTITPPGVADAGQVVWAVSRPTQSLDPITAFDIPENSIISSLCEALMVQRPDLSIEPGLAESATYESDRSLVLRLREGVTFSNGAPMTAEDVTFSLQRAADPTSASFYSPAFSHVSSITATGPLEVTIALSQPDYFLVNELSAMPGMVVQKEYVQRQGPDYGTPDGGVMCTGPFRLRSWEAGADVVIERSPDYWQPDGRAMTEVITFRPVSGTAAVTNALTTGAVDGMYNPILATAEKLRTDPGLSTAHGPSLVTDALIVADLDGPLGTSEARQALSLALDRAGYVEAAYHGAAVVARGLSNPGSWAAAPTVYEDAADARPALVRDLAAAKQLAERSGLTGDTIVMAAADGELHATEASMVSSAARAIGVEVTIRTFPRSTYGSLFVDPEARRDIDLIPTLNNPDAADPGLFLSALTAPGASLNLGGYSNPVVSDLLERARGTADGAARATLVAEAETIVLDELPWIPVADLRSVVYQNTRITGAVASFAFEQGPWATDIGLDE
jgi:peptide/nickel transport system substrate-binding protein